MTDPTQQSTADVDPDVVVVGGGLAGIAAALRCADLGRRVSLVETRPRLGGAAFSFQRGALSVDNGQHVFLRCCEAYRRLLTRLDVTAKTTLQPRLDINVLRPDGRRGRLQRVPGLPAPAHLSLALTRYGLLSPLDRVRAARAAVALRLLRADDPALDGQTLGGFLRRHGQSPALIESLWGVVAKATLNTSLDDASLALAVKVFRTSLLEHAGAADVGYAHAPLGDLHSTAARHSLERAGVEVLTGHKVDAVRGGQVQLHHRHDPVVRRAPAIVLAVPPREAFRIAPQLSGTRAGRARELRTSPIVNVHVVYDRAVTDLPFAAAVESPVQWFFDRTASSGLAAQQPGAQYLAVTVSAADDIIDTPSPHLRKVFVDELQRLLPAAGRAQVLDAFVTRERHATFRQVAGTAALRPDTAAGPAGVWLAGAWTDTGWPDTMEGAVRSGVRAAEAASGLGERQMTSYHS